MPELDRPPPPVPWQRSSRPRGAALPVLPLLLVLSSQAPQQACPTPAPADMEPPASAALEVFTAADGTRFTVEIVATNLQIPWSLAFAPDGRLFVTERPGRVRILQDGALLPEPALTLTDVVAQGEGGLLGLTLDPGFAENHLVYLAYTAAGAGGRVINRVARYREVGNVLGEPVVLLDEIAAASFHNGSRVRFGPDGRLYVTMGDATNPSLAQDLASPNGKILRMNPDGTMPSDNPFPSLVFSLGHRNPQGIAWHPLSGDLWSTEHGEIGNDEVNLIEAGQNYGWPLIEGADSGPGLRAPVLVFTPSIAPSGASFYTGTRLPTFSHDLFFATLRGEHIHRVRFDPADPRRILSDERLLEGRFGRIRDIVPGPDGGLYFCTSNRDGRGRPVATDDRIARIVPLP